MKCKSIEFKIIMYSELTVFEKEIVNSHIEHCQSCAARFADLIDQRVALLKLGKDNRFDLSDGLLANRIMASLSAKQKPKDFISSIQMFLFPALRYGLAAATFFFILIFAIQTMNDSEVRAGIVSDITSGEQSLPILNTAEFTQSYQDRVEMVDSKKLIVLKCFKLCSRADSRVACEVCKQIATNNP